MRRQLLSVLGSAALLCWAPLANAQDEHTEGDSCDPEVDTAAACTETDDMNGFWWCGAAGQGPDPTWNFVDCGGLEDSYNESGFDFTLNLTCGTPSCEGADTFCPTPNDDGSCPDDVELVSWCEHWWFGADCLGDADDGWCIMRTRNIYGPEEGGGFQFCPAGSSCVSGADSWSGEATGGNDIPIERCTDSLGTCALGQEGGSCVGDVATSCFSFIGEDDEAIITIGDLYGEDCSVKGASCFEVDGASVCGGNVAGECNLSDGIFCAGSEDISENTACDMTNVIFGESGDENGTCVTDAELYPSCDSDDFQAGCIGSMLNYGCAAGQRYILDCEEVAEGCLYDPSADFDFPYCHGVAEGDYCDTTPDNKGVFRCGDGLVCSPSGTCLPGGDGPGDDTVGDDDVTGGDDDVTGGDDVSGGDDNTGSDDDDNTGTESGGDNSSAGDESSASDDESGDDESSSDDDDDDDDDGAGLGNSTRRDDPAEGDGDGGGGTTVNCDSTRGGSVSLAGLVVMTALVSTRRRRR